MAIVIDKKAIHKLSYIFSYLSPGEAKGFSFKEIEKAKKWVSTPKSATGIDN
jgi:hypothetical protein